VSVRVQRHGEAPRVWTEPVVFTRARPTARALQPIGVETGD
jgi:hypothetical protein